MDVILIPETEGQAKPSQGCLIFARENIVPFRSFVERLHNRVGSKAVQVKANARFLDLIFSTPGYALPAKVVRAIKTAFIYIEKRM